ncbi:MAG: HEPN domain-containing protein [Anaerolineae bacterium]
MKDPQGEAERWLSQAEYDLEAARYNAGGGFHSVACFHAQQAAEKALKALLYARGERIVTGHSVSVLGKRCAGYEAEFASLTSRIGRLDRFYIPTRYPNALPGGVPGEEYDETDSEKAISLAAEALEMVKKYL